MTYDFKLMEEIAWAAFITFLTYVLTIFVQISDPLDWKTWLPAALIGGARAAAGVLLAYLGKGAMRR